MFSLDLLGPRLEWGPLAAQSRESVRRRGPLMATRYAFLACLINNFTKALKLVED
jgi:hypothetical protein